MNKNLLNVSLAFLSLVIVFAVLLAFEVLLRLTGGVKPISNSRGLFVVGAFGHSKGNAKNVEAVSFGEKVYTDKFGFRVPKGYKEDGSKQYAGTILILGDSVAFGVGVKEQFTLAALTRAALPTSRVYNSAVIGYNSYDYENVIDNFLPSHPEITRVLLLYCLNDLNSDSAALIDGELNTRQQKTNLFDSARHVGIIAGMNEFLRANSLLYVYLKGLLTDPQMRFYKADSLYYNADNNALFTKNIQPIVNIANALKARHIPFTVIIAPYEVQLRKTAEAPPEPQKKLSAFFRTNGIDFIDPAPDFLAKGISSKEFYLYGDPMHFSEMGHRVMFDALMRKRL
jgi:lysophospholipase L1-like esterase